MNRTETRKAETIAAAMEAAARQALEAWDGLNAALDATGASAGDLAEHMNQLHDAARALNHQAAEVRLFGVDILTAETVTAGMSIYDQD